MVSPRTKTKKHSFHPLSFKQVIKYEVICQIVHEHNTATHHWKKRHPQRPNSASHTHLYIITYTYLLTHESDRKYIHAYPGTFLEGDGVWILRTYHKAVSIYFTHVRRSFRVVGRKLHGIVSMTKRIILSVTAMKTSICSPRPTHTRASLVK